MIDLFDLIENIRKRPVMYLGRSSIAQLRTFLAGYCFARRQMGIPQTEQEQTFAMFQSWIQQKFGISSNQHWDQIILFFSQDERDAIDSFFDLFDEFVKSVQDFDDEPSGEFRQPTIAVSNQS
ncbi:MAG: hypothetical protein F6K10_00950 [Moorea sp. SIO2B7]|nr:hypothetical protein [Moorena sp. SIO2B7]